jgi:hypothetical protein
LSGLTLDIEYTKNVGLLDQEIKGCRCKDWRHEMTRKLGVGNITCNDKI